MYNNSYGSTPNQAMDDAKPKRARLDYFPYVVVKIHGSWVEFQKYLKQQEGE